MKQDHEADGLAVVDHPELPSGAADQREFWKRESWAYFERNYTGKDLRALPPGDYLVRLIDSHPLGLEGGAILDLGCGPANNLHYLATRLGAARAAGVESSERTVEVLASVYPEYEFLTGDCVSLPFETGEFDLVLLRGVLCWIDRAWVLQTLGEAIRVAKRYLIVNDFAPTAAYSTLYHHDPRYRTYKMDYQPLLEATGLVRCDASLTSFPGDEWKSCRTALYRKLPLDAAFPLRGQDEGAHHACRCGGKCREER